MIAPGLCFVHRQRRTAMPLINVTFTSAHKQPASKAAVAAEVRRLASTILSKDPGITAVIVQQVAPEDWFAGGQPIADTGLATFWLDIHVTEGNDTKDGKA